MASADLLTLNLNRMKNQKLLKVANVRERMDAHYRGEISYSRAVELLNEDANKALAIAVVGRTCGFGKTIIQEQNTDTKIATIDGLHSFQRDDTIESGHCNFTICGTHFNPDKREMIIQCEIESNNGCPTGETCDTWQFCFEKGFCLRCD